MLSAIPHFSMQRDRFAMTPGYQFCSRKITYKYYEDINSCAFGNSPKRNDIFLRATVQKKLIMNSFQLSHAQFYNFIEHNS